MTDQLHPLLLFGPGYSAKALASIWEGEIRGTYRSENSRAKLAGTRIEPVSLDNAAGLNKALQDAHLVISAPPQANGCPAHAALGAFAGLARSITYLSTTGVYGDLGGGWAMEWSRVNPQSDRSKRRVLAEQQWTEARPDLRIVRLPGIYGPGRSPLDRVRAGEAQRIIKPGQVFSRMHVDDIASGLKALILSGEAGVFHLCDDVAAPPQDVTAFAANLLDTPVPEAVPIESADLSEMARSFYSECKRVSNARAKAASGWRPKYPTYREGLTAVLRSEA